MLAQKIKSVLEDDCIITTVDEIGGDSNSIIDNSVEVDQPQLLHMTHAHSSHSLNQDFNSITTPLQSASAQTETHGSPPSTAKRKVHKHKSLGMMFVSYNLKELFYNNN